jgi:hypothetical protein
MFFKESYDEGKKTEDKYYDFFKEHFNDPKLKQTNRFSTFDFTSDNITIELKKRNFKSDKYKDYMIGLNKIEKANQVVLKIERFLKLITLKKNIEISENDNDNVDFVNECLKENDWNNEKLVTDAVRKVKKTIN